MMFPQDGSNKDGNKERDKERKIERKKDRKGGFVFNITMMTSRVKSRSNSIGSGFIQVLASLLSS